jgi:ribonuclease HI
MVLRKNCLYIYTDGSSLPKPRRGGIGIRYIYLDELEKENRIDLECDGYKSATNNQMELMAVIEGLRRIKDQNIPSMYGSIEVRTDSKYVVDNFWSAVNYWSRSKWLDKYGKPYENADLWKELIKVRRSIRCKVSFEWVKGHKKDQDNKAVDHLAKNSAKSILHPPLSAVNLRRKKSPLKTKRGSVSMKGQRIAIRIITEHFLHLQELSKYRFEVISSGSEYFGHVDFAYSELHHLKAGHQYIVTLNKNDKNPRILRLIKELTA